MKLSDYALHPKTISAIHAYLKNPLQSVVLTADRGFGMDTLTLLLADQLTSGRQEHQLHIRPMETGIITIDQIRSVKEFVKLKASSHDTRLVIVIHRSPLMNDEAQNALLKVLEEPPYNCFFILTMYMNEAMLPTIQSRVISMYFQPPTREELYNYCITRNFVENDIAKALAMSSGLPGLTLSILKNEASEFIDSINNAKKILTSTVEVRLEFLDVLAKSKTSAYLLCDSLIVIAKASIYSMIHASKSPLTWQNKLELISNAEEMLQNNVSTKLVLTKLLIMI